MRRRTGTFPADGRGLVRVWRRKGRAAAALVICLAAAGRAPARDADPAASDARTLERRVHELEAQNADLLRRLERLERNQEPQRTARETGPEAVAPAAPVPRTEQGHDHVRSRVSDALADVRGAYQLFADAGFGYQSAPPSGTGDNAFALGQLDLFLTGQVGDRFHAVAEIAAEGDSQDNETGFDVERLWGSWTFGDALALKLGREHSPQSRWNRRYHHGRWMWMSATQPFLARFEDDGGPLAVHEVGLEADGRLAAPVGMLEYTTAVSNGRGRTPEEVQNFGDHNSNKAVDAGFGFFPARLPGFGAGASLHLDDIPTLPGDPQRRHGIGELVGTTYVEHFGSRMETLGEFAWIQHRDRTSDHTFDSRAGYLQLGYHLGRFTPFTRFDWRGMARGDPFYALESIDLDQWEQMLGVRYDLTEYLAVKLEGGGGREQRRESSRVSSGSFGRIAAQFALVF